jgi:hypothetical protein
MCPVWNERDLTGRKVCEDSFYTKNAGCNSALDRINVENDQRPQYAEYITLDASGYRANMFDEQKTGVENYVRRTEIRPHHTVENFIKSNYSTPKQYCNRSIENFKPHIEQYDHRAVEYVKSRERYVKGEENTMVEQNASNRVDTLDNVHKYAGQFGLMSDFSSVQPKCNLYPYEYAMASVAQNQRYAQGMAEGSKDFSYRQSSQ